MTDSLENAQPSGEGTFWLYKQHDLLLGPVPYETIVEQLYAGELDGETPICEQGDRGGDFKPLKENALFLVPLAKAGAKLKVEAQRRDVVQTERRAFGVKALVIGVLSVAGVALIGALAHYLAVHRPWERKVVLPDPVITDELPMIALASKGSSDDEGVAYPSDAPESARRERRSGSARQGPAKPKGQASAAGKPSRATSRPAERDGLESVQSWDEDAIQQILASKKKTLHPCLTAEAHRQTNPGWSARVPLEFTVSNAGKVTKLWIDHHDYKDPSSELHKCMFNTLKTWQFPAYEGEQANVSMVFNVAL